MTTRAAIVDMQKDERTLFRSMRARLWARRMTYCLFFLCLAAIWQDRRLAPPVHDGMQNIASMTMAYIANNETLSEALVELQKSYAELTSDS